MMKETMPKDLQRWEVTRQQGRLRFILLNGVLAWGVPMFVVMTFFVNFHGDKPRSAGMILLLAGVWALCGAGYGWGLWSAHERKYRKYLAANWQLNRPKTIP